MKPKNVCHVVYNASGQPVGVLEVWPGYQGSSDTPAGSRYHPLPGHEKPGEGCFIWFYHNGGFAQSLRLRDGVPVG